MVLLGESVVPEEFLKVYTVDERRVALETPEERSLAGL